MTRGIDGTVARFVLIAAYVRDGGVSGAVARYCKGGEQKGHEDEDNGGRNVHFASEWALGWISGVRRLLGGGTGKGRIGLKGEDEF